MGPFAGTTTVDEVIRSDAQLNRVLGAYGIDTCCGGALTLAEAAEAQGVGLQVILAGLNASAAPQPPSPPAPQSALRAPSPTRYLRFFVASLLFALTFGAALGACMLGSMTLPWNLLHGLPLAAVKTAHAYAQVYGFATLFIMGVAYHVVARFSGAPLAAPELAAASFWFQAGGVLSVALGTLAGAPISAPAQVVGTAALLSAALVLGWNIHRTLAAGTQPHEPYESYLRAGCAWLVVATGLGLATAISGRTALQPVMWESALWGFLASWLFGMSLRILPVFMGVASASPRAAERLFVGYETSVAGWVTVAFIDVWTPLPIGRAVAGTALAVTTFGLVLQIGVLGRREPSAADDGGYAKFIVAAYAWLLLALVFAPAWSAGAALGGAGVPSLLFDFGRHAFTLGFLTQMIIGVATRIVPVFTGAPLWSRKTRDVTFCLLNAAVAARALQVVVELAGSDAAWPYISLSGAFGLAAFVGFAINVFMTIRSRTATVVSAPTAASRTTLSADALVVDLVTIPGALDLLVARGFRPLSNPTTRAAMAGTVTLRQACRMHGVDVEPLVAELCTLANAKGSHEGGFNHMRSTPREKVELPAALQAEPIVVRDPFLEFLGLVPAGAPISITFDELVKAAGHVCPTVAGAYLILRHGLKALYGSEPAVRGAVRVTAYGGPADFGYGPIAQLVNFVIGAAPDTGFGGLARGRFRRRDLFVFKRDDIRRNEFDFERLDTGRRVRVVYDASVIAATPQLAASIGSALADGASAADVAQFRHLWLQRVEDILAAGEHVVDVSEVIEATQAAGAQPA